MGTINIDHLAIPTANAERLLEFYKRLSFVIPDEAEWRAGSSGKITQPQSS